MKKLSAVFLALVIIISSFSAVNVFAADATDEELAAMTAGEANRMSVMITGVPKVIGETVYNMLVKLASEEGFTEADLQEGEQMDGKNVYRSIFPVTAENVGEYYSAQ